MSSDAVIETPRLRLRRVTLEDAEFLRTLVNEPSWLQFIGDRHVRSLDDARGYIERSYLSMYARCGHGLYLVESKPDHVPLGVCGLLQREGLTDVDLGYAFLPAYWGKGYAREAAQASLDYAKSELKLSRVIALTALDNERSTHLLDKLGFHFERIGRITRDGPESKLFVREL